jgi:excisionase family DNA binding protein
VSDLSIHRPPLNIRDAAEFCGTTPRHMTRLVAERRIPFFKLAGTSIRFDPSELDKWLLAQPRHEAIAQRPSDLAVRRVRTNNGSTSGNAAKATPDARNSGAK